jgi:NAD+ kinase
MSTRACPVPRVVGIVRKNTSESAARRAKEVVRFLSRRRITALTDEEVLGRKSDLVVVLGGDGTLIHAARLVGSRAVPILGCNMGSLGFLTEISQEELFPALELVLAGKGELSDRMKLRVHLHREGKPDKKELDIEVLNDVVINRGALAQLAEIGITCNQDEVANFRADGIIIATPTGSTAYALAAGGPILYPSMQAVVLAPICPHTLTQRPLVVPNDREINIVLKSARGEVFLSLDGQAGVALRRGDRVQIKQSKNKVALVRSPSLDYFGVLREKLHWGER